MFNSKHHLNLIIHFKVTKKMAACGWGYSSGVEHSTADREVPGSIPGVPLPFPVIHLGVKVLP